MDDTRVKTFRTLKRPCVELSQVAQRYKSKKATGKDLVTAAESLVETLGSVSRPTSLLDPKLADYAFFPLIPIFRAPKDLPLRAVEVAIQCLQILILYGWRTQLPADVGKQLLILLCFIAGGSATEAKAKDVDEEVGAAAFECLASLFQTSRASFLGIPAIGSDNVPIFGHSVTVMLDGVTEGPSVRVRLAALAALDSMIDGTSDDEAIRDVFPGIVSSLTKMLSSKSGSKRSFKVLSSSLVALTKTLCNVIGDDKVGESKDAPSHAMAVVKSGNNGTGSWATATAAQVKMALANILPLRYHNRSEVRNTLSGLCTSVIQKCRWSLSQSIPMLTETLVALCSRSSDSDDANLFNIASILATDTALLEMVRSSLHDWIVALPRVMQSNDDTRKSRTIEHVSTAFKILENQDISLDVLNESMSASLRASVSAAIQASSKTIHSVSDTSLEVTQVLQSTVATSKSLDFRLVLLNESSNRTTMNGLQRLAVQLKDLPMSKILQQGIINTLRTTTGDEQLASLWLSLQLLTDTSSESSFMDQYLNLPPDQSSEQPMLDDVYSFALDVLGKSTFEDEDRWKIQALSLEAIALQAQQQKHDFRPELVDALYPILERLGSRNAALQQHAMTCLNIVSNACEYPNSAALIIDNADYLVNAVALKLNTFDISPQAPQVLVMMVRLCGSALIPYFDDLVESVFSILACYHGYPKLVESLFSVLNAIVEEAAKTSTPAIKASTDTTTRPQPYKPLSIASLASILRSNLEASTRPLSPPSSPPPEPITTTTRDPDADLNAEEEEPTTPPRPTSPPPLPLSKTHILITSITSLTPSHLTTPSVGLRAHILNLLTSALPFLATNTDTFLPLAATLWPAITARLYDTEPYITLAAAHALATLCQCAGDFLVGRVEDEWVGLGKVYKWVEGEMREEQRVQGKKGRGMRWRVWDAVVSLILTIIKDVGIGAEMEDAVFEMLGPLAGERGDITEVLEELNADALWVVEERVRRTNGGERLVKPEGVDGVVFRDVELKGSDMGVEVVRKSGGLRAGKGGASPLESLKLEGIYPSIRMK